MGKKMLSTLRFTAASVLAVGIAFVAVAVIMPGEQVSGTQSVAAISPAPTPQRPSYLAEVPRKSPDLFEADASTVPAVANAQLKIGTTPVAKAQQPDPNAYRISASALNIREEPTSQSPSLFVLDYGTSVEVAEMDGNWAQITDPEGRTGWAFAKYLSPPDDASGDTASLND